MSKTTMRVIPCGSFDIPGLELWLSKLAGRGLRYLTTFGPFACLEAVAPARVQVHAEPHQRPAEENPELNAL